MPADRFVGSRLCHPFQGGSDMRPILTAAVLCGLLGALFAAPAPSETPKQLLYVSTKGGNADVYLVNPDGSGAKNLTDHKSENTFPCWSPDGKKIAFTSDRSGALNIFVMDADGKNVKALTAENENCRA